MVMTIGNIELRNVEIRPTITSLGRKILSCKIDTKELSKPIANIITINGGRAVSIINNSSVRFGLYKEDIERFGANPDLLD